VVAAVHVGRRGLLNGVAVKTVELMREMGARKISAVMGPAICGRCYEVSQEVHDEVVALYPLASARTVAGTPALDLPKALKDSLAADGISDISDLQICTVESDDHFSYRRDGLTGRQVGLVSL
jgi:copper oxidase (laccase) domain-containing protein